MRAWCFVFWLSTTTLFANYPAPFPDSLTVALEAALKSSAYQKIIKQYDLPEKRYQLYLGLYDTQFTHSLSYLKDETQKASTFFPQQSQTQLNNQVKKTFQTGTTLSLTHSVSDTNYTYTANSSLNRSFYNQQLSLSLTQQLWGTNSARYHHLSNDLALIKKKQDTLLLLDDTEQLLYSLLQQYWDLVQAKIQLDIRKDDAQTALKLYNVNLKNAESGLINERVLSTLKSSRIQSKMEVSRADTVFFSRLTTLTYPLNIPSDQFPLISNLTSLETFVDSLPSLPPFSSSFASHRRLEFSKLNENVFSISKQLIQEENRLPVSLSTDLQSNGVSDRLRDSSKDTFSASNLSVQAGLSLSFLNSSTYKLSKLTLAQRQELLSQYDTQTLNTKLSTEHQILSHQIENLKRELIEAKQYVRSCYQTFTLDQDYFKQGRIDIDILLQTQASYRRAQLHYASLLVDYIKTYNQLYRLHNVLLDTIMLHSKKPGEK